MPRTLSPGQRSQLLVVDVASGAVTVVHESAALLYEAPNWTPDGRWLLVNGDGHLFRLPADGSPRTAELERIDLGGVPPLNNDHVLSPDGEVVYVSADDGHVHAVPLPGGGSSRRVTNDRGPGFRHFLHGVSPDGATLAYIGMQEGPGGAVRTDVFTVPAAGGQDVQLTDDAFPDDGAEFSPDGRWLYFNSERGSTAPGHAQLFRMRPDGSGAEQLTHDERVNWFPHPSPDGQQVAYVSFPPGTLGHPADRDVLVRLTGPAGGPVRDLVAVLGGQGTMNVPSWAPGSDRLALVAYPVDRP